MRLLCLVALTLSSSIAFADDTDQTVTDPNPETKRPYAPAAWDGVYSQGGTCAETPAFDPSGPDDQVVWRREAKGDLGLLCPETCENPAQTRITGGVAAVTLLWAEPPRARERRGFPVAMHRINVKLPVGETRNEDGTTVLLGHRRVPMTPRSWSHDGPRVSNQVVVTGMFAEIDGNRGGQVLATVGKDNKFALELAEEPNCAIDFVTASGGGGGGGGNAHYRCKNACGKQRFSCVGSCGGAAKCIAACNRTSSQCEKGC